MSGGAWSKPRLARMHDVMAAHVERGEMPGIVTLLSRRGDVHVDAIGQTAIGGREPMRRDTIFRITSMTKPVTAVAAMILVEECALRLDEPVDRLLPELADRRVLKSLEGPLDDTLPANRPITLLWHLLGVGPAGATGRDHDDPARGISRRGGGSRRLLDVGLPGDRRLTDSQAPVRMTTVTAEG
jgi:Beta-lactamase